MANWRCCAVLSTKTTGIGWIKAEKWLFFDKMALFSKKTSKKFASSEKSITFAPAIERGCLGNAEIAQLVEHNLAKVGVAGPSPVFRSLVEQKRDIKDWP